MSTTIWSTAATPALDDVVDGTSLRNRAQYILDLGAQGVWGDCEVFEYTYAGPGSTQHPAYDVQGSSSVISPSPMSSMS